MVEKSIVDKHGDVTARHRTDIETEWRHRTFPRRFAPLLCRVMSSSKVGEQGFPYAPHLSGTHDSCLVSVRMSFLQYTMTCLGGRFGWVCLNQCTKQN